VDWNLKKTVLTILILDSLIMMSFYLKKKVKGMKAFVSFLVFCFFFVRLPVAV